MEIDGARLKRERIARFLTQEELAAKAELTESTVNRLERGLQSARISTVRKLARALGVDPQNLVSGQQGRPQDES